MFVFFLHLLTLSRLNYDDKKCLILMYIPLKNHYRFGLAQLGSQATGSPYKLCITLFLRVETTIESLHGQKICSVWLQIFITSIISFTAQIGHAKSTRVVNVVPPFYELRSSTWYYKPAEAIVKVSHVYRIFGYLLEKHSYSNIYFNNVMNY